MIVTDRLNVGWGFMLCDYSHPYPGLPPSRGKELGLKGKNQIRELRFISMAAPANITSLVTLTFALTRLFQGFAEHHARHVEFVIGTAQ